MRLSSRCARFDGDPRRAPGDPPVSIFAGLDAADARTRENASTLAYFLFDGRDEYALSPKGQRRLRDLHG